MISSGTSAFVRCTCSATGRILSSAKRRNVSATSSKSSERCVGPVPCFAHCSASRVEELGRAVRGDERQRRRERRRRRRPTSRSRPMQRVRDVGDRVGDVRAREHRLDLAVLAVVAHHLRALDRGGRVREVVGEHLVLVELGDGDLAVVGRRARRACRRPRSTTAAASVDGRASRAELVGHAREARPGRARSRLDERALRRRRWSCGVRRRRSRGGVVASAGGRRRRSRRSWAVRRRRRRRRSSVVAVLVPVLASPALSSESCRGRSTRAVVVAAAGASRRVSPPSAIVYVDRLRRRRPARRCRQRLSSSANTGVARYVGAGRREVHAVADAHSHARLAVRRRAASRGVLAVLVGEQRVRVDVDDVGRALRGLLAHHAVDLDDALVAFVVAASSARRSRRRCGASRRRRSRSIIVVDAARGSRPPSRGRRRRSRRRELTTSASLVPIMNTTASGSSLGHLLCRVRPASRAMPRHRARSRPCSRRACRRRRSRRRAVPSAGPSAPGERVAADPQPQRVVVGERPRRSSASAAVVGRSTSAPSAATDRAGQHVGADAAGRVVGERERGDGAGRADDQRDRRGPPAQRYRRRRGRRARAACGCRSSSELGMRIGASGSGSDSVEAASRASRAIVVVRPCRDSGQSRGRRGSGRLGVRPELGAVQVGVQAAAREQLVVRARSRRSGRRRRRGCGRRRRSSTGGAR